MNLSIFKSLVDQAMSIWIAGGWGMIALAVNALVMFGMGAYVLVKLLDGGVLLSPDRAFRRWGAGRSPSGPLERLIDRAMAEGAEANVEMFFDALRRGEVSPFEADLRAMRVSVSTAPLLGLLGTVTGMLATFAALAAGGGGDQTMGMVAGGISEALITTETGLVLGLAGMMFEFVLRRQHDLLLIKLAHVETLCIEAARSRRPVRAEPVRAAPVRAAGRRAEPALEAVA